MALNIKDEEAVALATEVAALTGETKTRAIKVALQERKARVSARKVERDRGARLRGFLESEVWPQIPASELGQPLSKDERETILAYGNEGA